jgi:outer membrane protein assembly factor BamB
MRWTRVKKVSLSFVSVTVMALVTAVGATGATASTDWGAYLHGPGHSSFSPNDATITPDVVRAGLRQLWTFTPAKHSGRALPLLYGSPTVYQGNVYIGAYDGYFYKIDISTQAVTSRDLGWMQCAGKRKAGIGDTATAIPDPNRPGHSTLYIASGKPGGATGLYLWALDASTLEPISTWPVDPVPVSSQSDAFPWSSPTVIGGHIYLGVSAHCEDSSLVQGRLVAFNAADGSRSAKPYVVVKHDLGGAIWTSAAADRGSVYVTTGNAVEATPNHIKGDSYSLVKLDRATLAKEGIWTAPSAAASFAEGLDQDFGGSPTLFARTVGASNQAMVGACDKDGYYYTLDRATMALQWKFKIGVDNLFNRSHGFNACIDSAVWDSTAKQLVIGGNQPATPIDGDASAFGSVRALRPGDGAVIWDNALPCGVIGGPTENGAGVVAVTTYTCAPASSGQHYVYLFDARNPVPGVGNPDAPLLARIPTASASFAQPVFAEGKLFIASAKTGTGAGMLAVYGP